MKKFEYKKVNLKETDADVIFVLNELGKDGWELIDCTNHSYLLKREIPFVIKRDDKQLLQESYVHED